MKIRLITRVLMALCAVTAIVWAANGERKKEDDALPAELRHVLDGLDKANKKLKDVRAEIEYRREIPLLDESQECEGSSLAYKKPNLIHLKLGKPRNEEVYTDGKKWWVVSHNDKLVEIYEAADPDQPASEASFLTFGFGQSSKKLLEDYKITLEDKRKEKKQPVTFYRLKFVPREEEKKEGQKERKPARFGKIEVEIADDLWLPHVIVLHESDGEIIHTFRLRKIKLDSGLKAQRFTYKRPRGYSEFRP